MRFLQNQNFLTNVTLSLGLDSEGARGGVCRDKRREREEREDEHAE